MVSLEMDSSIGSRPLAVEGSNISFTYDSKNESMTLNEVYISVEKGTIYGLLGPSGCGKTTLLRCIVGRLTPTNGSIKVFGKYPGDKKFCIPGRGVGYMPQELALSPDLTTEEILTYFGRLNLMSHSQILKRITFLLNFLEIPKPRSFIRNLSGGQKRRVSFAAAFIHEPPLLILDEPTVGVDPLLRHSIWKHLKDMAVTSKMSIIITTHYVEEARQAHTVGLLRDGRLLAEMNPEQLIQRHNAQNLEDVFWKLCRKEAIIMDQGAVENSHSTILFENNVANYGKEEKVWITREELNNSGKNMDHTKSTEAEEPLVNGPALLLEDNSLDLDISYGQPSGFTSVMNSLIRMSTLIAKSFICLKRNKWFFFVQVFLPALEVLMFYGCVGQQPFDLPLGIVNDEAGKYGFSELLINSLSNHTFRKEIHPNLSSALEEVKNGKAWGAMYIGPRFSVATIDRLLEGNNVENSTIEDSVIKFHLDTTNQQITLSIMYSVMNSFQSFAKDMLISVYENPRLSDPPITLEKPVYGDLKPNFTAFITPGIILGIIYVTALGLTALSIIVERKEGLLERSWVTGVGAVEVIFSIIFSLFITMIIQVSLVMITSFFFINLPTQGSLLLLFFCIMLSGTTGMGNGLIISALCREEVIAMVLTVFVFFPIFIISGILWPVEGMHYILRYISLASPLSLLTDSMRSIMSRGWGFTEHYTWIGFIVPAVWTVVFIVAATLIFKLKKV